MAIRAEADRDRGEGKQLRPNRRLEESDGVMQSARIMNAAEIIEEISRLTEEERSKVIDFVYHLPNAETGEAINEPVEGLPRYKSMSEVRNAIKGLVDEA